MVLSSTQPSVQWTLRTLALGVRAAKSDQLSLKTQSKTEHTTQIKASATTAMGSIANKQ